MKRTSQSGNAVVFILIGVALFGALAATFMRGAKTGQGNLSAQQAKIAAQDIMNYSQTIAKAVDKVRSKGCSENQISFQASGNTGYTNPSTPPDGSCKIFDSAGGGMTFTAAPSNALDLTAQAAASHGILAEWFFPSDICIPAQGNGSTAANCYGAIPQDRMEMIVFLPFVRKDVCEEINKALGISTMPTGGVYTSITAANKFTGSFLTSAGTVPTSYATACYNDTNASSPGIGYHFFQVLLAR